MSAVPESVEHLLRRVLASQEDLSERLKRVEEALVERERVVEGYPAIGLLIRRSARTAERLAAREHDPLPVTIHLGSALAYVSEVKSWLKREERTKKGRGARTAARKIKRAKPTSRHRRRA